MKPINQRYIYRTGYQSWVVRIPGHHTKSFPYNKYNGKNEALKIARKWRDKECNQLDIKIDNHSNNLGKCRKNAKGYFLLKKKSGTKCWRATYSYHGKTKSKSFAVNKYGFDHARKLAKQHRTFLKTGVLIPFKEII